MFGTRHAITRARALLDRERARSGSADEERQLELCRYMWWMRHALMVLLFALQLREGVGGRADALMAAAVLWGFLGHAAVQWTPRSSRAVTVLDGATLVGLAVAGLPPAAVLVLCVTLLAWAATFRPVASLATLALVIAAVLALHRVHPDVSGGLVLAGFAMLAVIFTMRMIRLNLAARRVEDRERLVEGSVDVVVWEEVPGVPDAMKVSAAAERLLGQRPSAFLRPGFWRTLVHPDDLPLVEHQIAERRDGSSATIRVVTSAGQRWFENRVAMVPDRAGRPAFLVGALIDRTEHMDAEREALTFGHLVAVSPIGQIVVRRVSGTPRVEAANEACHRLLGTGPGFVGEMLSAAAPNPRVVRLAQLLAGTADEDAEFPGADGRLYHATVRHMGGDDCSVDFMDVTQRVETGRLLHAQARQDELTGLPNRRAFLESLEERLRREPGRTMAVLIVDLDNFKDVNDGLGHETGDALLQQIGGRLTEIIGRGEMLARLGGDEFALVIPDAAADEAMARARALIGAVAVPVDVGHLRLRVRASVGVAVHPEDARDAVEVLRHADLAMYEAKERGSGVELFRAGSDRYALDRLALGTELEQAIASDQLMLEHQPLVDVRSGAIIGTEVLARWEHPTHGRIPPLHFIETAEVSGNITALTRWVIRRALSDLVALGDAGRTLEVSVNLSVRNLYEPDLPAWLAAELARAGVEPERLVVEITESMIMDNAELALELIHAIRATGVRVWIDDFGTGHSSLGRLRMLPVDGVKIDRSFVSGAADTDADLVVLRSMVAMMRALGLQVVAEGVETEQVMDLLRELKCPLAQGYHLGRPTSLEHLRERLAAAAGQSRAGLPGPTGVPPDAP